MKESRKNFWKGFLCGILFLLVLGGAFFAGTRLYGVFAPSRLAGGAQEAVHDKDLSEKLDLLGGMIDESFLREVDPDTLKTGIYKGLVAALGDPYSAYYTPEELEALEQSTSGIYSGIGATVQIDQETLFPLLSAITEDSPAQEAGLLPGDLLTAVDGTDVQGMDLSSTVALIKGEEGTTVHLTILREGESLEFDVQRRRLSVSTVNSRMLGDGLAYIQITEFDQVTQDQFTEALAVCRGEGMTGLVLDLRGNPGGNLDTVCQVARSLLPEGLIVYTEDKYGNRQEYSCDGKHQLELPLAVLVDGNSASASEILAGAIKDYGIGTLVGTTTFGKGIVQSIMKLSDGSALKLTVSDYYTPKGNNIHEVGIKPDVEVPFDAEAYAEGTDNQLEEAVKLLREEIP